MIFLGSQATFSVKNRRISPILAVGDFYVFLNFTAFYSSLKNRFVCITASMW
ncbi:hypothetical protein CAMSH0001_2292 [Campylobacter showae RM3277]|uniref:Uncharacterized protein n=1 Tax=Campylobacter showae RM3277 TaxID=553219 RepID=C6RG28_9BACT|nr:hypothetical protein CAMSH0001_2292 [Campylobacter showae RM3277]